ncbi:MAG: oxidoreductase [Pelagibacteraceae bacterium]|jgi:nucleoside-diphosphate-sugar epimerase|nr:oxidoreductase [Pelagibacteraceae bacterium]|tara:strand:+ start:2836 stop:3711 length:876 start_codon:yes stop_codon:yes gene_type:complete
MNTIKVFCFGFGQVAKHFVKKIISQNLTLELSVTSRQETHKEVFEGINFTSYEFENDKFDENINLKIKEADYILVSVPPISGEDIVIKNFKILLKNTKAKWITYLSATSVYGNHNGEWVNEKSETKPSTLNGKNRLKAENDWRVFSKENNLPLQIFRLSGIYSKQNNILKRLKTGQAKIIKKEKHFFSRIHVEDIANILFISLKKFKTNEIFNISDDQPASQEEVAVYGALLLKMNKPNSLKIEDLEEGMLKDFYKESKKVDNKKIKIFFNYQFIYPSYKEGLDNIVNDFI